MPNANITLKANATENPPAPSYGGGGGGSSSGCSEVSCGYYYYDQNGDRQYTSDYNDAMSNFQNNGTGELYYDYPGGKNCVSNC